MKMLFENWRGFVNEQAEIIDFPAPESRGDDERSSVKFQRNVCEV